jgi:hypothetical protein
MINKFLGFALDLCEMTCLGMFVLMILFVARALGA